MAILPPTTYSIILPAEKITSGDAMGSTQISVGITLATSNISLGYQLTKKELESITHGYDNVHIGPEEFPHEDYTPPPLWRRVLMTLKHLLRAK